MLRRISRAMRRMCSVSVWPIIPVHATIELAGRPLHRYTLVMADGPRLTYASCLILQAVATGHIYGYTVMEATGLPSGTVYPALRRLEREQFIQSRWERQSIADAALRPARKYFSLTRHGKSVLEASIKRYPLLAHLTPSKEVQDR